MKCAWVRMLLVVPLLTDAAWSGPAAPRVSSNQDERTAFVAAAKRGDENAVRKSLEADSTLVTATDELGMTALDWAATREHWHIFRQLLEHEAPVDRVGSDGGTVLHRTAHHDRADMVELLVDAGADIRVQNQWGRTPLHVAARRGCREVARLLLDLGADPNATTREGWTTLHVAYRAGQPELVELLLASGADPQARDTMGKVPAADASTRPTAVEIPAYQLFEYQGLYDVSDRFYFRAWIEDGRLMLQDFGADALYHTGPDSFYSESEPWSVWFQRNETGDIYAVEVRFLRRSVRGLKRGHPLYVGSHVCKACHLDQGHGNQYVEWLSSRHAAAYWRLATDWSLFLALLRPHFQDMKNPLTDDRCLLCHTTAAQDPDALFSETFEVEEGVGCEACHGPGSGYIDPTIMSNRSAFIEAGGRVPDEGTCRRCHRNAERFSFDEWWPRITHRLPG